MFFVEIFENLSFGLSVAFTPANLLFLLIGALVGMVVACSQALALRRVSRY